MIPTVPNLRETLKKKTVVRESTTSTSKISTSSKTTSWKNDKMPEYYLGRNVYDFIDPDIEAKLGALEDEEARLEDEGYYDDEEDEELEDAETSDMKYKAELIREKRQLIRNENKMRKSLKNRAVIPRSKKAVQFDKMEKSLQSAGYDTTAISARARSQSRPRGRASASASAAQTPDAADAMDVDPTPRERLSRSSIRCAPALSVCCQQKGGRRDG